MADLKIADDYSYIAQRMKEIEEERNPQPRALMPVPNNCSECRDTGWLKSRECGWRTCPICTNSEPKGDMI